MSQESEQPPQEEDLGKALLRGLALELLRRLKDPKLAAEVSAAEGELIRKLCSDSSVTLASIKAGDFGKVAQRVAEEYPFPEGGQVDMTAH
jgi:hypothetical protein